METQTKQQRMKERILENIEQTRKINRWSILDDEYKGNPVWRCGVSYDTSGLRHKGYVARDFIEFPKYGFKSPSHKDFENALASHIRHLIAENKKWRHYAETDYSWWKFDSAEMAQAYAEVIPIEQKIFEDTLSIPYTDKFPYEPFRAIEENKSLSAEEWENYKRDHLNDSHTLLDKIRNYFS